LASTLTMAPSSSLSSAISSITNYQSSSHTRSHSGFNLKNKIKSWFSTNSSNSNVHAISSSNNNNNKNNNTNTLMSSASSSNLHGQYSSPLRNHSQSKTLDSKFSTASYKSPAAQTTRTNLPKPPSNKAVVTPEKTYITNNSKVFLMKHSTSESSSVKDYLK
jgi:hypothetical protein